MPLYCQNCTQDKKLIDVSMGVGPGTCASCGKSGMCHDVPRDPDAYRRFMYPDRFNDPQPAQSVVTQPAPTTMDEKFSTSLERRGLRWWLIAVSEQRRIVIGPRWTRRALLALRTDKAYSAIFAGLPQSANDR